MANPPDAMSLATKGTQLMNRATLRHMDSADIHEALVMLQRAEALKGTLSVFEARLVSRNRARAALMYAFDGLRVAHGPWVPSMSAGDYNESVLSPARVRLANGVRELAATVEEGEQANLLSVAVKTLGVATSMAGLLQNDCAAGRLLLVQFDDRPEDELDSRLQSLLARNRRWCEARPRCVYSFWSKRLGLPPYWAKLEAVKRSLKSAAAEDTVLWLDTDAAIEQDPRSLLLRREPPVSLMITRDMEPWQEQPFNAGVFLLRADDDGRRLLRDWLSVCPRKRWRHDAAQRTGRTADGGWEWKGWRCEGCNSSCVRYNPQHEGEPEYTGFEQGALLQAGLHLDPAVGLADWRMLNSPYPFAPAFVHHYASAWLDRHSQLLGFDGEYPSD